MKVWVVKLDTFLGVYSTKEKAVEACIHWVSLSEAEILEFNEIDDGFSMLVRFDECTPQESCEWYFVPFVELDDGFDWED